MTPHGPRQSRIDASIVFDLSMLSPAHLRTNLLVKLGEATGATHVLPMLLFAPTARCNSRCLSCDWWRADGKTDLTLDEIQALAAELPRLGTRTVVFTGGEPLVRPDVLEVADLFRKQGLRLQLLTSGLALERFAVPIAARFDAVTISLDGHTRQLYRQIRGVDGLDVVVSGVRKLREIAPQVTIRARSTLHRLNFRFVPDLIAKSRELGLDQISFLAADVSSDAFNRPAGLPQAGADANGLLLDSGEVTEFESVIEATIRSSVRELAVGKVSPAATGLRKLVQYYRAQLGEGPFPSVDCNAPWVSAFLEANGAVRPCFFHPPVGNIRDLSLTQIVRRSMPVFRRGLSVADNRVCQRCVCTLKTGLRSKLW
jgi:Fe-coproporphyrin III synthase